MLHNLEHAPQNILVASATGSGKTKIIELAAEKARDARFVVLVAEPLVALAVQIYKRLVAQKLSSKLVTGTVKKDCEEPHAIVYTYEALSRACEDFSPAMASAMAIVVDEFHYIASDRGGAIQEILIFAAENKIPIIALSGTLPNTEEVASYLTATNGLPTTTIGTKLRPVPLKYYTLDLPSLELTDALLTEGEEIPKVVSGIQTKQELCSLLHLLRAKELLPCLIVGFSCERINWWAETAATIDFLSSKSQRFAVTQRFQKMEQSLPPEDRLLLDGLLHLAQQGVFVHHSHKPAPYLEYVCGVAEIKCSPVVFCTSTLSAGINLPVRTVVLAETQIPAPLQPPLTGCTMELIDPLLFNQIAGRAGRAGYESVGHVIVVHRNDFHRACKIFYRSLPDVKPSCGTSEGDALRSLLRQRMTDVGVAIFDNTELALLRREQAHLKKELRSLDEKSCRMGSIAAELLSLPKPIRSFLVQRGGLLSLHEEEGRVSFKQTNSGCVLRQPKQKPKAVPLEHYLEIQELRTMTQSLVSLYEADYEQEAVDAGYKECIMRKDLVARAAVPHVLDSFPHLHKSGYATLDLTLTAKGRAACELRSAPYPHALLEALLSRASWETVDLVSLASASLLSGRGGSSWRSVLEVYCKHAYASEESHIDFAVGWAGGASLYDLWNMLGVPPGPGCRIVTRTYGVLEEMTRAAGSLGVEIARIEDAMRCIRRGLPFSDREELQAI